jgi:hypothetical protein
MSQDDSIRFSDDWRASFIGVSLLFSFTFTQSILSSLSYTNNVSRGDASVSMHAMNLSAIKTPPMRTRAFVDDSSDDDDVVGVGVASAASPGNDGTAASAPNT